MPEKYRFEAQATLSTTDFSFRENDMAGGAQANETFITQASPNRSLGRNGETLGFAKKQYSNDQKLQKIRDNAASPLGMEMVELKSKTGVKEWVMDRSNLENIEKRITEITNIFNKAVADLEAAKNAETPDPDAVKEAQRLADYQGADLAAMRRIESNKELEAMRLQEVWNRNPAVQEYLKAAQKHEIAASLAASISNVAESTSHLYEDRGKMSDPKIGGDRQLLARAVASHEVDKMIGLQVCAEEKFAMDADGELFGVSIQCDGAGVTAKFGTNQYGEKQTAFLNIDYSKPAVQRGLHDLEALDYITGQCDRHTGNIFVDPESGKVTGIDNDLAFPEVDRELMLERADALKQKTVAGMPKMMHAETAAKIAAVKPDEFRKMLQNVSPPNGDRGLGEKEISGAVKRLGDLQHAIQNGAGIQIVPQFNQETYKAALEAQAKENKYCASIVGGIDRVRADVQARLDSKLASHCMRGPETVEKAAVNPALPAVRRLDQLTPAEQADFRAALTALNKTEDKLAAVREKLAKLAKVEKPSMRDRLAAMRYGGMEGARRQLRNQEAELTKEVTARVKGVNVMAYGVLEKTAGPKTAQNHDRVVAGNGVKNNIAAAQAPAQGRHVSDELAALSKLAKPRIPAKAHDAGDGREAAEWQAELEAHPVKHSVGEEMHRPAHGPQEMKPAGNSVRGSGAWKPEAKQPPAPKQGGGALSHQ
jgi:hypothetical protein